MDARNSIFLEGVVKIKTKLLKPNNAPSFWIIEVVDEGQGDTAFLFTDKAQFVGFLEQASEQLKEVKDGTDN